MNHLALILALIIFSLTSVAQEDNTKKEEQLANITVVINKTRNNNGKMLLALHNEQTFMKGEGIQHAKEAIIDGKVTVTFKNVPQGEYAIMVLHDENENNRMDFDEHRMPKEDYGVSNNDMSFGPPQFSSAKFKVVSEDITMEIRL